MLFSLSIPFKPIPVGLVIKGNRAFLSRDSAIYPRLPWTKKELRILLDSYEACLANEHDKRTDSQLWQDISNSLRENGFNRMASQCSSKWRRLRSTYEKAKESGNEISFPFQDKLDRILQEANTRNKLHSKKTPDNSKPRDSKVYGNSKEVSNVYARLSKLQDELSQDSITPISHTLRKEKGSFLPPDNATTNDLSHQLIELLRSQLEFQNSVYTNIVEELKKSHREEYQLRKEFLTVLKELDLTSQSTK